MKLNKGFSKLWFLAVLLVAFVTGCGGGGGGGGGGFIVGSSKAITSYSLVGVKATIHETAKTIAVTVPSGTTVTALAATFKTTGSVVKVAAVVQASGTTTNNFTAPVAYIVTAADGTTATYTVTVTVASATAKAITSFALNGVSGTVNEAAKTIAVTMPNGTNVTALVATFTTSGTGVKVAGAAQASGTTPNNFTAPVAYTVTAGDTTTAIYTVTVTVASLTAKAITAYSLDGVAGTVDEAAKSIVVAMPNGTNVTALIATFTITGTDAKVAGVTQTSGTTPNDFTAPVAYIVAAADSTTATYTVTVTATGVKGPGVVNLGTAGNYVILATSKVSTIPASVITGDVGLSPAATSFITGFSLTMVGTTAATSPQVTGFLYGADMTTPTSSNLTTAVTNMGTAYTDAAGRPTPDVLNLGTGEIGGKTIIPGLYKWTTGVTASSNFIISGGPNDVWIFQIPGNLTTSPGKGVTLSGGAQAKNIFWQVAGAVNIGTTSHFEGIILCKTAITMGTGSSINGRLLAQTAVVLDTTTVKKP